MKDLNIDENKKVVEGTSGDDPRPFRNKVLPHAIFESLQTYRIDRSSIKAAEIEVAPQKGGNADVELAIFCPNLPVQSPATDAPQYIAVRKTRFRDDADDQRVRARFAYELDILVKVSHENIVKLVGFVESTEDRIAWMVFRWEENGNLREFVSSAEWEIPERISLIRDVASGLEYLHSQDSPICHGDLKSLNILVSSESRAMITDFGSARILPTSDGATETNQEGILNEYPRDGSTRGAVDFFQVEVDESATFVTITGPDWTVRWAAPELLDEGPTSLSSDIWAFGWICWEVMTGHFPFEDVDRFPGIVARIIQGKLPQTDDQVYLSQVRELCSLMTSCWRATASNRPTAESCRGNLNWMTSIVPSAARVGGRPQTHSAELLLAIGRTHYEHGRLREAAHHFTKSLEIARQTKNDLGVAEAVYGLADIAHDSSEAESLYTEAHAIFSRLGYQLGAARAAERLGSIFSTQGCYSKAESMQHEAQDIYERAENLPGLGNSCLALGALYRLQKKHSKAESLLNRARDIFDLVDQRRGVANANIELGRLHGTQGHYAKAEELLVEARELYEQIGDQLGLANAMCGLGEAYYVRAEYETSEAFFTQAKDISTLVKNQLGIAHSFLGLGNVHLKQEKYTKAESCYIEAQSTYNRMGNRLGIAESSSGLSKVYYRQGFCHKAEPALIECRDAYARLGDQSGLAGAICGLGHVYYRQNEYAKAEVSFTEARMLFEQEGDQDGIAQSAFGLGNIYHWLDRDSEAEALLSEARDAYTQIGDQSSVAEVVAMLGNVYRSQCDYSGAETSYVEAIEVCSRLGRKHFKADVLYDLGLLRGRQERFLDTEQCIEDACAIYSELGLDDEVLRCVQLLEKIREMIRIVNQEDDLLD